MNIHPKVAWPAIVTAVLAVIKAVLIANKVHINADVEASVTALVLLVAGYLAPSPAPPNVLPLINAQPPTAAQVAP